MSSPVNTVTQPKFQGKGHCVSTMGGQMKEKVIEKVGDTEGLQAKEATLKGQVFVTYRSSDSQVRKEMGGKEDGLGVVTYESGLQLRNFGPIGLQSNSGPNGLQSNSGPNGLQSNSSPRSFKKNGLSLLKRKEGNGPGLVGVRAEGNEGVFSQRERETEWCYLDPDGDGALAAEAREAMGTGECRSAATDEALLSEASRYGKELSSFGGKNPLVSSSSPFSFFGRAPSKRGSFGVGKGQLTEPDARLSPLEVQEPPLLLLGREDQRDVDQVRYEEWALSIEDDEGDEAPVDQSIGMEKEELRGKWEDSCLAKFSRAMGFPTEGFEEEILDLLKRIQSRRVKGKIIAPISKFDRELKKLEWSVNYNRKKTGQGTDKEVGSKSDCLK